MQLVATGKWSKEQKRWLMVVAMRRQSAAQTTRPGTSAKRPTRPKKH
jgi:hypothetical protein